MFPRLREEHMHEGWAMLASSAELDYASQATFTVYASESRGSDNLVQALEAFAIELGYGEPSLISDENGSRLRRWGSKARAVVDTEAVQKAAYALELAALGERQAGVTESLARAARDVVESLGDQTCAVARAGQILVVKFVRDGQPIIIMRTLSVAELLVLERFPEVERYPERVLDALSVALSLHPDKATLKEILPPTV